MLKMDTFKKMYKLHPETEYLCRYKILYASFYTQEMILAKRRRHTSKNSFKDGFWFFCPGLSIYLKRSQQIA